MNEENTETLDIAPTWGGLAPMLVEIIGSPEVPEGAKKDAWAELRRMAQLADRAKGFVLALNAALYSLRAAVEDHEGWLDSAKQSIEMADRALSGEPPKEETTIIKP